MRIFNYALEFLKTNFRTLIVFELVYKLFAITLFTPLLLGLFNLTLKFAGFKYLSNENLLDFLTNPASIILIIFIFSGITFFTLIEITAIIRCFHGSFYNQKISVMEMLRSGIYSAKKLFKKRNWLLIIFVVFIIPLTNFTIFSSYASGLAIPEFIMEFIIANALLFGLFILFISALVLLAIRWIFSIHYFTLDSENFKEARKNSLELIKGRYISSIFKLFIWHMLISLLVLIVSAICIAVIIIVVKIFCSANTAYSAALTVTNVVLTAITAIYSLFSVPIIFAFLSSLYYSYKTETSEKIEPYKLPDIPCKRSLKTKSFIVLILVVVLINGLYLGFVKISDSSLNVQILSKPEITAHRGDSISAPENTMPAFESAISKLADYAELDVHQTKDGVIVVIHDDNIKRISGKDINIWDITYEELQKIDVGSWFAPEFDYVRVATLDEVIKYCKGRIKLNIELKPNGHETNYEESVLSVINENNFRLDCVVSSLNTDSLKNVKKIDPNIKTVFLMAVAYGNIYDMKFADAFSIESSFITSKMVKNVHEEGKDIYAWTVNNEENMKRVIDLGVDSIVTDNPIAAREIIYGSSINKGVATIISCILTTSE